jgi:thiol-disulfide isomerase/thioredoxin
MQKLARHVPTRFLFPLVAVMFALQAGCGDGNAIGQDPTVSADSGVGDNDGSMRPEDAEASQPADAGVVASDGVDVPDSAKCGPGIYPCGPYGTKKGDVVDTLTLEGFADKDYLCKGNKDLQQDLAVSRSFSFKDFHQGTVKCRQLLWLIFSAGWCGPCIDEAAELQKELKEGSFDDRVLIVTIVLDDVQGNPATLDFAKEWAKNDKFSLDVPVLADSKWQLNPFFGPDSGLPYNLLIDLSTMKILEIIDGYEPGFASIKQFFSANLK